MKQTRRAFLASTTAAAMVGVQPLPVAASPETIEERILAMLPPPPDDLRFRKLCRLKFLEMRDKGLLSPSCVAALR